MYLYVCVFLLKVQVDVEGGFILIVLGGGLIYFIYKVVQFYFYWGSDNIKGLEYIYNGKFYFVEVWYYQILFFRIVKFILCVC